MERISLSRPSITDEEVAAAESTLRSRWLVYGPQNRAFEDELGAACGRRHAIAVSSGTAALHLLMLAVYGPAGPAAGTRLLAPAFTFPASVNVLRFLPGPPVTVHLADVDPQTFCLPAATLQAWQASGPALTMVVHQFGYPSPLPPLSAEAERLVISDAACAIGAAAALRGRAACLSFHPRKLLTTGEGGAILTDDDALAAELRQLRAHGLVAVTGEEVQTLPAPGLNYRLPELGAAIGRVQLRRLPTLLALHRERAERYRARLGAAGLPLQADTPERVWQTLSVILPDRVDRQQLRAELLAAGIETQIASYGLHRLAAYKDAPVFAPGGAASAQSTGASALPVTERLHQKGLALPLHSELSLADVDRVCDALLSRLGPRAGA
jgi:dTDP-4-amino-4,6-dideoxygalactose transaminase